MPTTWTRTVLMMALLGGAVVQTSTQLNAATSNLTATAHAGQTQDQTAQPAQAIKSPETKADGDYVGSDTCVTCHEDQSRRFNRTAMGKAMAHPHTPDEARGCESCHGPGRVHVEAGGGKDTIPFRFTEDSKNTVAEKNFACLQCHSRKNQLFWRGSPHESRAMTCVDCHQAHQELHPPLSHEARFNALYGIKMADVFMFSTSTILLRTAIVPRWIAFLGYGLGAVLLLSIGIIRWIPLVFPTWVFLISVAILFENPSSISETHQ